MAAAATASCADFSEVTGCLKCLQGSAVCCLVFGICCAPCTLGLSMVPSGAWTELPRRRQKRNRKHNGRQQLHCRRSVRRLMRETKRGPRRRGPHRDTSVATCRPGPVDTRLHPSGAVFVECAMLTKPHFTGTQERDVCQWSAKRIPRHRALRQPVPLCKMRSLRLTGAGNELGRAWPGPGPH